jgi:hypothetical protein
MTIPIDHAAKPVKKHRETLAKPGQVKRWKYQFAGNCWATIEHRNATIAGLQYLDESMGNALAATVKPNQIDVRYHKTFTDERVLANFELMFRMLDLDRADSFSVYYQGRLLIDRNE